MPINNNWDIFGDGPVPAPEPGWGQVNIPQAEPAQQQLNGLQAGYVVMDEHYDMPQPLPQEIDALNEALGANIFNANAQAYYNAFKGKDMFTSKKSKTMATPSASQLSDEYRVLTSQIRELKGSLQQESEELASVLEKIATQVEVVRDIGSLIHTRISSLQKAANQLENWRLSLPQPDSPDSQKGLSVDRFSPVQVGPPVQAGQVQVGPGLWQQDQV